MSILKKTLFAGLAALTFSTAGAAITATSADAHYRGYTTHHGCYYKQVWKKNYYGHGRWVTIRICS